MPSEATLRAAERVIGWIKEYNDLAIQPISLPDAQGLAREIDKEFADVRLALEEAERFMVTAYRHAVSPDLFEDAEAFEASICEHTSIKQVRAARAKVKIDG